MKLMANVERCWTSMNDIHYAHAIKHCILTANTRFTTIMQYRRQEPQLLLRSISMVMLLIIVTDLTAKTYEKPEYLMTFFTQLNNKHKLTLCQCTPELWSSWNMCFVSFYVICIYGWPKKWATIKNHHKISLTLDFSSILSIKWAHEYYKFGLNILYNLICDIISSCVWIHDKINVHDKIKTENQKIWKSKKLGLLRPPKFCNRLTALKRTS